MDGCSAPIKLDDIPGHALRNGDHNTVTCETVERVLQRGGHRIEDGFAQSGASLEFFERQVPGTIANVPGKNVPAEGAEPLAMDNVKAAANLEASRQCERKHRGKSVCSPGWDGVEADARRAVPLNSVGKDVDLVLFCEARR